MEITLGPQSPREPEAIFSRKSNVYIQPGGLAFWFRLLRSTGPLGRIPRKTVYQSEATRVHYLNLEYSGNRTKQIRP